jgi:putative N6-adenine-specific DNA methylase
MLHSALDLFAITAPGLEALTGAELLALGITPREVERGGVSWSGEMDDVYIANLCLRTASRILVRVTTFRASTFFELERRAKRVPWSQYISPGRPVRFRVTCRKSRLYHSGAVAQRLIEAVTQFTGDAQLAGPAKGGDDQDVTDAQLFVVRLDHDSVTISADASGILLHRRGYRQATAKAPLRETLAAAMLLASGWDRHAPLVDPLCGSGTVAIEAALLARNIAPGQNRSFAFVHWPHFDEGRWLLRKHRLRETELPRVPGVIRASDRDAGAVRAALDNAERAGVEADIDVSQLAISAVQPAGGKGWIVTNPPYGVRVGDASVRNLYAQLGKVGQSIFSGWNVGLLSADPALERQVGIKFDQMFRTSNGGIPVRFVLGAATPAAATYAYRSTRSIGRRNLREK